MLSFILLVIGANYQRPITLSEVFLQSGEVYARGSRGVVKFTDRNTDYDASLSEDRSKALFCRKTNAGNRSDLYMIDLKRAGQRDMMLSTEVYSDGRWFGGCQIPQIAPDGQFAYYVVDYSDTSGLLVRVDLRSGDKRPLGPAIDFKVVAKGKHKGKLAVMKRKMTLVRVWNWYWLVDAEGREIAPIGDENDLILFLEEGPR